MHKKNIFLLIGLFWLVIIGGFIGYKEFTLKTGDEILLKTRPVDPRDLFRGDYVILRYEISRIDTKETTFKAADFESGDKVYVRLNVDDEQVGNLAGIGKDKPAVGKFIEGEVVRVYGDNLEVEYGIESYFVPEGRGKEIEREMGKIYTKVAIDDFGNAVIRSLVLDGEEIKLK